MTQVLIGMTRTPIYAYAAVALGLACASPSSTNVGSPAGRMVYDVIVRGGSVLDGTGRPAVRADVGIIGSRIGSVANLSRDSGTTIVDASGLVVAPGFINIHSHAVPTSLPTAANMLQQGVTTELVNSDGGGPLDIAQQLRAAESATLAVNVGAYAPFNSAWATVVGASDRRPSADEIAQVTAHLKRALEAGAWGVSAGLDYKPGYYATTDEVVAVLSPLREWRTNFPNHDRLTPEHGFSSIVAMRETIEIGERAGLVPVITHMKLQGKEQGRADSALAIMRAATARGAYTAADVYPYLAGQTSLAALFVPGWAQEGGRDALVQRLRDPSLRTRIVRETEEGLVARVGGPANVYVIGRNKTLSVLMTELGGVSSGEAIARILEVESPGMIATFGAEADLVKLIQYPDAAIACDCGASRNAAHPRYFGTFPRVLGRYARESHSITLAEAVRKMTALPATIVGMVDRGFIATGMAADITVFDPNAVIDRSTYERPMELSEGIRHVLVNGQVAFRDGKATGMTAGRVLRRTRAMPSRPLRVSPSGELKRDATAGERTLRVDFARRRLALAGGGEVMGSTDFGLLQTGPRWASVTGMIQRATHDRPRGFVLIIDDKAGDATLYIDGDPPLAYRLER